MCPPAAGSRWPAGTSKAASGSEAHGSAWRSYFFFQRSNDSFIILIDDSSS